MHFESEEDRKNIDNIIAGFESFCVGAVNVTYEQYRFNKRTEDVGERFDVYLSELRRLAKSWNFAAMEESMLRDRIVVGIREDDVTRRKLLQMRDLTLNQAIVQSERNCRTTAQRDGDSRRSPAAEVRETAATPPRTWWTCNRRTRTTTSIWAYVSWEYRWVTATHWVMHSTTHTL